MKVSEKIRNVCWKDGDITAECGGGHIHMEAYGSNIIHFLYYPDQKPELPMWGIEERKDSGIIRTAVSQKMNGNMEYSLPNMTAQINVIDGSITFTDAEGETLVALLRYELDPVSMSGEDTYHIRAEFSAEASECYYGLGQHQDGALDLGGKTQILWHDYSHKGGEIVAVPFLISNHGYAVLFDNASRMKVSPGMDKKTIWEAEAGEALSFFLISGRQTDELYAGYRHLCGETPLPPKAGLGFIQCKQRYASSKELLEVARTYKEKGYPCDIFVVDWFHWKVLGDLSTDPVYWPDSKAMNEEMTRMGYDVMISCWPRFMKESVNYEYLESRGWFMKDAEGNTVYGTPEDQRGALIDTTDPECGRWYFDKIAQNYGNLGYKYWWTDENEPDISPRESWLHAGSGVKVHNIYPLTHTQYMYEGHRRTYSHRCLILSRAAFTGAQRYGTTFWSSDIFPEWDVLKRQIPTALNFCASGMPYWSSDIGGWQALEDEESSEDYSSLLIGTKSSGKSGVTKKNYTELYIRWFQFGAFCPTFRTHGTRKHNEVWSYGEEAEQILVKYLKLRYRLMPYIYSLAYHTWCSGAPFMRALWMDFTDKSCEKIPDEYMFGPSLLIAPVVEQGADRREVYLPAGEDWVDFHTGVNYAGGHTIRASAPIDILPIYVKAGSIIPMGEEIGSTKEEQRNMELCVYPGKDCAFLLYSDDGRSYDYEKGKSIKRQIVWKNADRELLLDGERLPCEKDGMKYRLRIMNK